MPFCAIKHCGQRSKTPNFKDYIFFHKFPNNARIRDVWINATSQDMGWIPDKHSVICSRHFTEDCFTNRKQGILYDNAVPTLNISVLSNLMPKTSIISSSLVQEDSSDPTSIIIQTIPVVTSDQGLTAVAMPVIPSQPKLTVVPLKQTNQVVIRMEEGIGVIKEEPVSPTSNSPPDMTIFANVANPTCRNDGQSTITHTANPTLTIVANTIFTNEANPKFTQASNPKFTQASNPTATKVAVRTANDPNDPLDIEVQSEPLEYLQSTKKKLWNNIINLKEKIKRKNLKIKRLQYSNKRLNKKVNELKLLVNDLTTELYGGEVLKSIDEEQDSDDMVDENDE